MLKDEPIINWDYLTKYIGFKRSQAIDMFPLFIQVLDEDIPKLEKACKEKDQKNIVSLAHKLKGSSLYCGALRLKEACTQLETCFERRKEKQLSSLCQKILQESQLARKEVLNILKHKLN